MSIENCIREFLRKTCIRFSIFDANMELSYDTDQIEVFTGNVIHSLVPNIPQIQSILNTIYEFLDSEDVDISNNVRDFSKLKKAEINVLSRDKESKYRIRNFVNSAESGAIIPLNFLINAGQYNITTIELGIIRKNIIDLVLEYGKSSISQVVFNDFFAKFIENKKNSVLAIYNVKNLSFIKLYSKNYFLYLLKGNKTVFESSIQHNYKVNISLINIANSSDLDFTQFFEIYDVIDEYHHSNDILIKYLKIYQIIEYLITRTMLVDIQQNKSNQNLFLREMTSLGKLNDFDEKYFKKVFESNELELKNWFKSKLLKSKELKLAVESLLSPSKVLVLNPNDLPSLYNWLFKLVYKIRNTIVHNKESEIHLTIHNIQLKPGIIKLIQELIKKFEEIIFNKVVVFENSITYNNKYLALY